MKIGDRVIGYLDEVVGTIVKIRNGYYYVDFDNGDCQMFLESELCPVYDR